MTAHRSTLQIVEDQIIRWQYIHTEKEQDPLKISVVTISREPGSGGKIVASKLARDLGLDLFHREIVLKMAESANVSTRLLETLDERGQNILEEWIASFYEKHLWPGAFKKHLARVIGVIGKHGNAVIVGRGANFFLPPEKTLNIRIVAPLNTRINNVSQEFEIPAAKAKKRITRTELERSAYIRKYFYTDISDISNYNLLINTERTGIDTAVEIIKSTLGVMVINEKKGGSHD